MYKYLHSFYQQIIRFGITGLINTAIDFTLFNLLLIGTGASSPGAVGLINILSVSLAATNSYLMNRHWTFAAVTPLKKSQVGRFIAATLIGLAINTMIVTGVGALAFWLPMPTYLVLNGGKLLGAFLSATWNFLVYRAWVFAEPGPAVRFSPLADGPVAGLVSLVIPAYNEASRLPARLEQLASLSTAENIELILVDDGSQDDTQSLAEEYARIHPDRVRVVGHGFNRGKGAAVNTGIAASRGEYLIFSDADTTFSPDHIRRIIRELQGGHDLVIGCRRTSSGGRMNGEGKLRQIMGWGFNLLVRLLILPGITDTQCGLKGFSRAAAHNLFNRQRTGGFAFDVEILALAHRLGLTVKVVEVEAAECAGSSVKCLPAVIRMGLDLLRIRWGLSRNYYGLPSGADGFPWAWAGGLFLLAFAVRLPWLWEVPRYIDELSEVNLAYTIYLGQVLPLTNMAHDIGSMHNYILAAIFKLLGPSIYWPRLYIAVTSALTVVTVFAIGRRLFGKTAGLLAAGLLLTNGMHIIVTHMAWSNSSTPFFFTLALLTLLKAEERQSGPWLLLSSLLWAATLQSHSSGIIYVLAAAIYLLVKKIRRQNRISWTWHGAGACLFLAGYANMIYYNLISRGGSFSWIGRKTYALEADPGLSAYLSNCGQMGIELLRSLGAVYSDPLTGGGWEPWAWMLLLLVLLVIGIRRGWQEGKTLPAIMILAGFLIIPWLNQRYTFYLATRYIMPLIICAQLYLAAALVWLGSELARWWSAGLLKERLRWRPQPIIVYTLVILLLGLQVMPFYQYCARLIPTNESNRMALNILAIIASSGMEKRVVVLDNALPLENKPLPYLLKLSRQPFITFDGEQSEINWSELEQKYPQTTVYAIMSAPAYARLAKAAPAVQVHQLKTRVSIPAPSQEPRQVYVLRLPAYKK